MMKRSLLKFWSKRAVVGLFSGVVLLGGLSACAHRAPGGGAQHSAADVAKFREKMIERVSSQLELNGDQKQKLSVLADKLQEQRLALKGKSVDPRTDLQGLISGEKFDRRRAQDMITEKTAAIASKSPEVVSAMGDFYDALNAAQQQKVRDFMQRGGRHWGRHG
jgi:periplasmic protein CpxP/Spy